MFKRLRKLRMSYSSTRKPRFSRLLPRPRGLCNKHPRALSDGHHFCVFRHFVSVVVLLSMGGEQSNYEFAPRGCLFFKITPQNGGFPLVFPFKPTKKWYKYRQKEKDTPTSIHKSQKTCRSLAQCTALTGAGGLPRLQLSV